MGLLKSVVKDVAKKVLVTAAVVIGERVVRKMLDKAAEKKMNPPPAGK